MFRLLLLGVLWLMAVSILVGASLLYFNGSQYLSHKRKMWRMKNEDE